MVSVAKQLVPESVINRTGADVFSIEPVAYYFTACLKSSDSEAIENAVEMMTFVESKVETKNSMAHMAYRISKAAFETQGRQSQPLSEKEHIVKF
jgi:hypothetical protein